MSDANKKAITLGEYLRVPEPVEPPAVTIKAILKRPETRPTKEEEEEEELLLPPLEPVDEAEEEVEESLDQPICYAVNAGALPANFPDFPVPYFEETLRRFKLVKKATDRYAKLSRSWAYEMRKRIDADEDASRALVRIFAIHRRAFNATVNVLWNRYGGSSRKTSDMIKYAFAKVTDPKGCMMRADPWIAKCGDSETLIRSAVVEAVHSYLAAGPDVILYKSSPKDDSETESVWIDFEKGDRFEGLDSVRLISETGDRGSFELRTDALNRLFCLAPSLDKGEKTRGFFLVRKGQDAFFVAYRFNDEDKSMCRVMLNAPVKCYVIPSPYFAADEATKVCVVACPSMSSHNLAFVYSPSPYLVEGLPPTRYVKARLPEDKKELVDELVRTYDHLIFYDREGDPYLAGAACERYYEMLCSSSKETKTLTFVKERESHRLCSSCHRDDTDVTNQYLSCYTCGNANGTDVNLAFSIWMKWCWGVVDQRASGFVLKTPTYLQ